MTPEQAGSARRLEGQHAGLALTSDNRIDDPVLEALDAKTIWLYTNGIEVVVPTAEITDLWEIHPGRAASSRPAR